MPEPFNCRFFDRIFIPRPGRFGFCGVHAQMRSASRRTRPNAICIPNRTGYYPRPGRFGFCGVHAQMRSASRRTRPNAICIPNRTGYYPRPGRFGFCGVHAQMRSAFLTEPDITPGPVGSVSNRTGYSAKTLNTPKTS